jgi:hypothetical protein
VHLPKKWRRPGFLREQSRVTTPLSFHSFRRWHER